MGFGLFGLRSRSRGLFRLGSFGSSDRFGVTGAL